MQAIKYIFARLLILIFLSHLLSCGKKEQRTSYADIVAQDPSYRMGKWRSVSNGAGFNFTTNPLLDTIWFISDSLAGWSFGGRPYLFRATYFSGIYSIVYLAPNPLDTVKIDTTIQQCGMTTSGDTFTIYWPISGLYEVFPEEYVKVKN
jgi:hypothetical protein